MLFIVTNKHGESMLSGELHHQWTPDTDWERAWMQMCPVEILSITAFHLSSLTWRQSWAQWLLLLHFSYASQMAQWWGIYFPMQEMEGTCVASLKLKTLREGMAAQAPVFLPWRIHMNEPGWLWSVRHKRQMQLSTDTHKVTALCSRRDKRFSTHGPSVISQPPFIYLSQCQVLY